jgi:putative peptide zinc metalloprotease protein
VLADATRVPVVSEMTIGRAVGSTVVLSDPSVSRTHARISAGAVLEDAGSSHGTWIDGVRVTGPMPLRDGAKIKLGDQELMVERRRDAAEAGRTIVVRPGASLVVPAAGQPDVTGTATQFGMRPRLRSGYALKRLEASEGSRRWVLRDLDSGTFLRFSDNDAHLLELLDGDHSLVDLIAEAEHRFGPTGSARLARLLSDLGERGLLAGVERSGGGPAVAAPASRLRRLFTPREKVFPGVGARIEWVYRHGGWLLFTQPVLWVLFAMVIAGPVIFTGLIAVRYGTPFVVANKLGWGGLVFLLGRFVFVAVHELAHGLTMASFGRRIERAGLKLIAIFPYAFVDTSESWFEPRRRRIMVSAAGPASDLTIGAVFAIGCLFIPKTHNLAGIFFNLAFAAYVGAFFNLNPFIERDGYHILVDVLREPGLRRRAKEQFARRLAGRGESTDSPVLLRYSIFGLVWSVLAAGFAIAMTFRYEKLLVHFAPNKATAYGVMGTLWVAFFIPVVVVLVQPLRERRRLREEG